MDNSIILQLPKFLFLTFSKKIRIFEIINEKITLLMRRDNTRSLADIIKELVDAYKLNDKLLESRIILSWEEVAGKYIARQTQRIYISNKILYVVIPSSVIKHELRLAHDDLLDKINTIAGKAYIQKIVFI